MVDWRTIEREIVVFLRSEGVSAHNVAIRDEDPAAGGGNYKAEDISVLNITALAHHLEQSLS
jgi:hypothetical protein